MATKSKIDLVRLRLLIGTQQQVADLLGLHRVTVNTYEKEGTPVPEWYRAALEGLRARQES